MSSSEASDQSSPQLSESSIDEEGAIAYHSSSSSSDSDDEGGKKAVPASEAADDEGKKKNIEALQALKKETAAQHAAASVAVPTKDLDIPWFEQRECLFLLLKARMMLREMVEIRFKVQSPF